MYIYIHRPVYTYIHMYIYGDDEADARVSDPAPT